MAAEGKAIAKVNDLVIFVPYVVPGDVVDLQIKRKKNKYAEAEAVKFPRISLQHVPFLSASTMAYAVVVSGKCFPMQSKSNTSRNKWKIT